MTYQMALLESKLEGEEKGRAQGREEGIESVAFNMIKKGMTFDSIAELTDLSVSHLKELAEKIKNIK